MTNRNFSVITVPGLYGSGCTHWQSRWEEKFGYTRAELGSWHEPSPSKWERALSSAVNSATGPVVLVGHSLGSILIARYMSKHRRRVAGAFLVAPTDIDGGNIPEAAKRFAPIPKVRLPVPTLVVATESDPYLSTERSQEFARVWGASLCLLEKGGHLGGGDALGDWDEGHELLCSFIGNVPRSSDEEIFHSRRLLA